jgi:hypothetical protein
MFCRLRHLSDISGRKVRFTTIIWRHVLLKQGDIELLLLVLEITVKGWHNLIMQEPEKDKIASGLSCFKLALRHQLLARLVVLGDEFFRSVRVGFRESLPFKSPDSCLPLAQSRR